ncbi:MAG: response regulator [Acidobacteriota bacterium]|nr:response regulator [Acidobacteriota bacterium]
MAKTVLIVEDDEPTQLLLVAVMRRGGLATIIAGNGRAAIELIETRNDIDCIILDLMMPDVDGRAVIAYMAATRRRIPVIVCTAAMPRTTTDFDPEIIRAVMRKPFDIDHLISTVSELVDSGSQSLP